MVRALVVPGGEAVIPWLVRVGATADPPAVIPVWPASRRKALVMVRRERDGGGETLAGYAVTTPAEMRHLFNTAAEPYLWCVASREALKAACPGLADADFPDG